MQTRLQNKKRSKKPLFIALAILVILVVAYMVFAYQTKAWPFPANTVNLSPTSNNEKKAGEQIKSDSVNNNDQPTKEAPSNDVDPSATSTSVLFSSSSQDDTTYHIRVLIGSVLSSGTCSLTLTKSGTQTYATSAEIQSGPSSSTCKGFDIPLTSLSTGTWNATVTVTSGSTTGSATQEISVK